MDTEQTQTTTEQAAADAPVATTTAAAPPAAETRAPDPVAPSSPLAAPSSAPAPKRPSLGRIVTFREFADVECCAFQDRAAIITAVWSDTCVNLTVFDPDGATRGVTSATLGTGHRSWSWPVMV